MRYAIQLSDAIQIQVKSSNLNYTKAIFNILKLANTDSEKLKIDVIVNQVLTSGPGNLHGELLKFNLPIIDFKYFIDNTLNMSKPFIYFSDGASGILFPGGTKT